MLCSVSQNALNQLSSHPICRTITYRFHDKDSQSRSMNSLSVFLAGVESFDVDIKEQKVTVKGNVQPDAVLQTVSKTGKKSAFWDTEAETAKA
ncbi:unnamed protein product [Brassica oleracea var. botrytis]